jgi:hypothetical protein
MLKNKQISKILITYRGKSKKFDEKKKEQEKEKASKVLY